MKIPTRLISNIACLVALTGSAAAQCTRHFYNDSPVPFTVIMYQGLCNNSLTCTLKPGETGTLVYFGLISGGIRVSSSFYNHDGFVVSACHIIHSGNTGAVAVNEPADGDVTTCGRDFQCPPIYCYGTFYNRTKVPFDVSLSEGACNDKTACTVPPGGGAKLTYNGSVQHSTLNANSSLFSTSVPVSGCGVTSPNFDRMRFNVPNAGDVTTCGGRDFPCPP